MTYAPDEQKTTSSTRQTRESARQTRTRGEDPVPAPGHSSGVFPRDFRDINGWGVDLDPADRPSVPRELPSDVKTVRGDVKYWQEPRFRIFMSNEQPGLTPVFGESCPPSGVSGLMRSYAYQYGEGTNRHWMTLLAADRVDVYVSAIKDMLTGRYPKDKAWSAYVKYGDRKRQRNLLMIGAAAVGAIALGYVLTTAMKKER